MNNSDIYILQDASISFNAETENTVTEFYNEIMTLEKKLKRPILILQDLKTNVFYTECHIFKNDFCKLKDENATIDPENQEEYRLNRNLQPKNLDFLTMKDDAAKGRQFSDIVIEFTKDYNYDKPLKILGGQHRAKAIEEKSPLSSVHGIRVYFNLSKESRAEIAIISNTNITISDDLLDRMDEQKLEPPNKLRNFAQKIGLLDKGKDFADKKANEENLPTVRLLRTFIINFYDGKEFEGTYDSSALESYICDTGNNKIDANYIKIFNKITSFSDEKDLIDAGVNFVKLHKKQYSIASTNEELKKKKEFKNKALTLTIVSGWSLVSGLLQKDSLRLKKFYDLPIHATKKDPLNSVDFASFKLKPFDDATYRGIATRTDAKERGRIVSIFLEYSKSTNLTIDKQLLTKAVNYYHSNKLRKQGDNY